MSNTKLPDHAVNGDAGPRRSFQGRDLVDTVAGSGFGRFGFRIIDIFVRRVLWAWGHWRRAAIFPHQGAGCICHWNAEIKYPERIRLGNRVIIGVNVVLGGAGGITLGNDVRISRDVMIETAGLNFDTEQPPYKHISAPIIIEDGVWIGARAMVLGNVTIGRNAVVAAGAIVTRNVAPGDLVGGVPAKAIKRSS